MTSTSGGGGGGVATIRAKIKYPAHVSIMILCDTACPLPHLQCSDHFRSVRYSYSEHLYQYQEGMVL